MAVTLGLIAAMKSVSCASDVAANATGYAAGLACSFTFNRHFTFQHRGTALSALARFLLLFVVAYAANLMLVLLLIGSGVDAYAAHLLGVPAYTLVTYIGQSRFVFVSR